MSADSNRTVAPGSSLPYPLCLYCFPSISLLVLCLWSLSSLWPLPPCPKSRALPTSHVSLSNNELLEISSTSLSHLGSHHPFDVSSHLVSSHLSSPFFLLFILHISAQKSPPLGSRSCPAPPWSANIIPFATSFDCLKIICLPSEVSCWATHHLNTGIVSYLLLGPAQHSTKHTPDAQ